ncbi:MAG: inorganic diphosphatase, partial [Bacteroidota bacterium]|nr:inorganic diphosphatase [Bacteroidota bacterium]
ILCVPVSDPIWNKITNLEEVNPHQLKEIEHFFQVYKDLEKKKVGIEGWEDKAAAIAAIKDAQKRFQEK